MTKTSILRNLVHHPRKLFLRKALFQIHLWAGIAIALYLIVIALSGAILVFEDELTGITLPATLSPFNEAKLAPIPLVFENVKQRWPGATVSFVTTPSVVVPAYRLRARDSSHHDFNLIADPVTGAVYPQPRTWVEWMHDLHLYLLLGSVVGIEINGIGAAILLVLSLSGIFLWWPGVKSWSRGLKIGFRHNWRRINFDAHHAIGFWTLAIVMWWAISGIYFTWFRQVAAVVNAISPLRGMKSPTVPPQPPASGHASLEAILAAAQQASPHGRLFGIGDLSLRDPTVFADMDLRAPGDFAHRDIVTIDTANARVLAVWHYGQNQTLGDWIMWSMHPFHFGTIWGTPVKVLWCLLGLSLAGLTLTGLIMYWNRYLRHRLPR